MSGILLTIIVPIYNKELLLRQCLDSFARESFAGRLEVLAIDDGSTDGSLSVAQEYGDKYPGIYRVIHKENGGVGSVINLGLGLASGRYVREVDADDYVRGEALEEFLDFIQNCDSDIVLSPYERVDEAGNHMNTQYMEGLEHGREYLLEELPVHVDIGIQGMSIHQRLLKQNGFSLEETRYYIDVQLVDEAIYHARTCIVFPKVLNCYRAAQADQSVSLEGYQRNRESFQRQLELKLERLARARREMISERKINRYEGAVFYACKMMYILFLMDAEGGAGECRRFDGMLRERYPDVYAVAGAVPLIKELRERDFENEAALRDRVLKAGDALRRMNHGKVTLEDISMAVSDGNDDDITVYRLRKGQEKVLEQMRLLDYWLGLHQKGIGLADFFKEAGFRKIAIYGCGILGQRLFQELLAGGVGSVYGIDRRVKSGDASFPVYRPEDELEEADAVVVTVLGDFAEIARLLREKVDCPILSLEEIVYGMPVRGCGNRGEV